MAFPYIKEKIKSSLRAIFFAGYSPTESETSNRITLFTNAMVIFAFFMGVFQIFHLPSMGIHNKHMWGIQLITFAPFFLIGFNYFGYRFLARFFTLILGTSVAWNAVIIFGKSFNGYYILFMLLVYSVLAFSKNSMRTRLIMIAIAYIQLPLVDWYYHSNIPTLIEGDARDFPFQILWVDTSLQTFWMILMIWIEKAQADKYEKGLGEALETISREQQRIQVVFDNVNQAILPLSNKLEIDTHYSAFAKTLLKEEELAGKSVVDVLFAKSNLNEDQISKMLTTIEFCIGEDELNWDLNSGTLPSQISVTNDDETMFLNLIWSPIIDNNIVASFILSVEDRTSFIKEKNRMKEQKKIETWIPQLITSLSQVGLAQLQQFLLNLNQFKILISEAGSKMDRKDLLRELHSFKGEARLLELGVLATIVHELESLVIENKDINLLESEQLNDFLTICDELQFASQKLLGSFSSQVSETSLFAYIGQLKKKIQNQLNKDKAHINISSITFKDEVDNWPSQLIRPMQTILLHTFQNIVDHGYILPKLDRDIVIAVRAQKEGETIVLSVEDFGNGLNVLKINKKFESLKESQRSLIEDPMDVLFLDEFSTADTTTLTSGRGVGLSAVKAQVESLHGQVKISNCEAHSGTLLKLTIPT